MTEIAVPSAAAEVHHWLGRFEDALAAGDGAAAAELFLDDSFWRDLVAFTWNIKTVEGRRRSRTCSTTRSATSGRGTGTRRRSPPPPTG